MRGSICCMPGQTIEDHILENTTMTIIKHVHVGGCLRGSLLPALHTVGDSVSAREMLKIRRQPMPWRWQHHQQQGMQPYMFYRQTPQHEYMDQQQSPFEAKLASIKLTDERLLCGDEKRNANLFRQPTPSFSDLAPATATTNALSAKSAWAQNAPARSTHAVKTSHVAMADLVSRTHLAADLAADLHQHAPHAATMSWRECSQLLSDCAFQSLDSSYYGHDDDCFKHDTVHVTRCSSDRHFDDTFRSCDKNLAANIAADFTLARGISADLTSLENLSVTWTEKSCWDDFIIEVDASSDDSDESLLGSVKPESVGVSKRRWCENEPQAQSVPSRKKARTI